jgi:cytidylate kinase
MPVITISRGSYSGGKALAECLARRLGYRVIDRETIIGDASSCGASEDKLRHAIVDPPGFRDHFNEEKRRYMTLFQACLTEEARKDNLIYVGNAGHLLLRGVSHVVRVRIIAPMSYRLAAVEESRHLDSDEARAYIEQVDHARAKWTRFLYGVDYGDPALYDLVINLERATVEDACATVAAIANEPTFRTTAESSAAMEDLALATRVRAALIVHPQTSALLLDAEARRGTVKLLGKVRDSQQRAAVEELARGVPGVERLILDDLVQALDR